MSLIYARDVIANAKTNDTDHPLVATPPHNHLGFARENRSLAAGENSVWIDPVTAM